MMAVVLGGILSSTSPQGAEALFAHRARVAIPAGDAPWVRLALPVDVLDRSASDGRDLRLITRDGRGVSFQFLRRHDEMEARRAVEPLGVTAVERTRPKEGEQSPWVERYRIALPHLNALSSWTLVLSTQRTDVVCGAALFSVHQGRTQSLGATQSVFRLSSQNMERLTLPLSPSLSEQFVELELTCDAGFLEPRFRMEGITSLMKTGEIEVPVSTTVRAGDESLIMTFRVSAGRAPRALRVSTSTRYFERSAVVRASDGSMVGRATIFRIPGAVAAEHLDIPIQSATSDMDVTLEIPYERGASLEDVTVKLVIDEAVVFFSADDVRDDALWLYFGGERVRSSQVASTARLELIARSPTKEARLETSSANPLYQAPDVLASLVKPGAVLDTRAFAQVAPLVGDCRDLCEVQLSPEWVGLLTPGLRDLRFVDEALRQIPFVMGEVEELREATLPLSRSQARESEYELKFLGPVSLESIALKDNQKYTFQRQARVVGTDSTGATVLLGSGILFNNRTERGAPSQLSIPIRATQVTSLKLILDDGSEASWPELTVSYQVSVPVAKLVTQATSISAVLGNPQAESARFDIDGMRDMLLALDAPRLSLGAPTANPQFRLLNRWSEGDMPSQVLLWSALGLAMVVLGALTVRLVRQSDDVK